MALMASMPLSAVNLKKPSRVARTLVLVRFYAAAPTSIGTGSLVRMRWSLRPICDGLPGRDGLDTLVLTSPLPADDPACPPLSQPGLLIQSGLDLNADGNLSEDEVSNQSVVCGGVNGLTTSLTMPILQKLVMVWADLSSELCRSQR